jgi:hypothetical protein
MILQVSTKEAMTAQCSAPPSDPANNAFLRPSLMPRIDRSTVLFDAAVINEARQALPTCTLQMKRVLMSDSRKSLARASSLSAIEWLDRLSERYARIPRTPPWRMSAKVIFLGAPYRMKTTKSCVIEILIWFQRPRTVQVWASGHFERSSP